MAGRPNARSSVNRDQASSPPMKSSQRVTVSKSPVTRATRATRSQSRDLGDYDTAMITRKSTRSRAARQGSVESTGSNASIDSRGERRRKKTRTTLASGELSIVAEEKEKKQQVELDPVNAPDNPKVLQSPGAMSNLSGTTALTSQSSQKMADLDTGMIVELIPDLSREAFQLLELLAPSNTSPTDIDFVIKELQVPGSGRGKRLRLREKTFDSTKENYTSDLFINPVLILRKIFNDHEPETGAFRPDLALYAANTATLVKELLVAQRDNPSTMELLQALDEEFPSPFISEFQSEPQFGSSALLYATVDLALELRTQTTIAMLKAYRDEVNYDPDQLLAQTFYEPPAHRNESLSIYADSLANDQFRKIAGIDVEAFGQGEKGSQDELSADIRQRVGAIREAFRLEEEAIEEGDYVDFDQLNDDFSWTLFLGNVVQWSQLRMEEINKSIEKQGGIENITRSLVERMQNSSTHVELFYKSSQQAEQTAKPKNGLLPAATIIPASAGKSLYNSSKSLQALLKRPLPTFSAPPSNQQQVGAPIRGARVLKPAAQPQTPRKQHAVAPSRLTDLTQEQLQGANDRALSDDSGASSKGEQLSLFYLGEKYTHKENLPILEQENAKAEKLRFVDPQPNAERVTWSQSQQSEEAEVKPRRTARGKRKSRTPEVEEEDEEDDAFQTDGRPVDGSRRKQVLPPVSQVRTSVPSTKSPSKRLLPQSLDASDADALAAQLRRREKRRRLEHEEIQEGSYEDEAQEDEVEFEGPRTHVAQADVEPTPSYAAVNQTARAINRQMLRRFEPVEPQRRQRWSDDETELLINLIGRYGCSWASILQKGRDGFSDGRDQGALKDKARNIKVDYLVAGTRLPLNFDGIALGKKEKEKVKARGMNPYRLEGEIEGDEIHDMEGNMIK